MLKEVLVLTLFVGGSVLLGQSTPTTTNPAAGVDLEQLKNRHIDTFAELESWVLAESALAEIADDLNVGDIVTPLAEFLKTTTKHLLDTFARFSESELGVSLELTPDNQVLVESIDPLGRFHFTDLQPNDVITEINGELKVDSLDDPVNTVQYYLFPYAEMIKGFPTLVLNVDRDGDSVDIELNNNDETLRSRFIERRMKLHTPGLKWMTDGTRTVALRFEPPPSVFLLEIEHDLGQYFDVEFGVLVLQAPKDGLFKAGDILLEVEDTPIRSIDHIAKALKNSNNKVLDSMVQRDGKAVNLEIERASVTFRNAEEQMTH